MIVSFLIFYIFFLFFLVVNICLLREVVIGYFVLLLLGWLCFWLGFFIFELLLVVRVVCYRLLVLGCFYECY